MKTLRWLIVALVMLSVCSITSAQAFFDDFESYAPGSELHGQGGWAGWDNTPGAGAPASDTFAYRSAISAEIVPSADLVHIFDVTGGKWVFSAMQYIPSGGTGETFFILLNTYSHGGTQNWSTQTKYNLASGAIETWSGPVSGTTVAFDRWVQLRYVINLDENTVDEYYDGTLIDTRPWDTDDHNTLQAIDLYGNNASSVYYDDLLLISTTGSDPVDGEPDAPRDVVLSWPISQYAASYNVYFGTSLEDVEAGDPSVLVSEGQTEASFDPEGLLDYDGVYYWRIDGVSPGGTVYTIGVWTFSVEPYVYPIENIIATSNTIPDAGAVPENTVNGSGLNENDEHSREAADMWLGVPEGTDPVYIQFEFDRIYKLHEMQVWNYNGEFEPLLAFGTKDITVEHSEDGAAWTVLGDVTLAQGTAQPDYKANTTIDFASIRAKFVRLTVNSGYGMFGQFGLSEVRILHKPVHARKPQPADGSVDVDPAAVLGWRQGREAASHEVHLSTDETAVADGAALVATVTENSYALGDLDIEYGATYYWKVNEVNEAEETSTWQGDVWTFTAAEFGVVDDFESYDDDENRIFDTWVDGFEIAGNGSQVGNLGAPFAEQTIVNNGNQSMPLFYDNSGIAMSEAEMTLSQDGSANGIHTLGLFFRGAINNSGQLYIMINGTKVTYDGDAEDIGSVVWLPWNIDLSAIGGNVSSITSLTIGVEGAGATGVVYIDDIRLYPKAPEFLVPAEPDAANLVAHYPLDGDATDSTGAYPGTTVGAPQFVPGKIGQAISLGGTGDYVEITGYKGVLGTSAVTVTAWVKTASTATGAILGWGPNTGGQRFGFRIDVGRLRFEHHGGNVQGDTALNDDMWHHIAVTIMPESTISYPEVILWLDARDNTRPTTDPDAFDLTAGEDARIGSRPATNDRFFAGQIDDVYIYDRVLSQEEIAWLAGKTNPMHKPL